MRYAEAMIAWNVEPPAIRVGLKSDNIATGWARPYRMSGGGCFFGRAEMSETEQLVMMFTDFHQIVVRDGLPADLVHSAFLAIDEYRRTISPDIQGADPD